MTQKTKEIQNKETVEVLREAHNKIQELTIQELLNDDIRNEIYLIKDSLVDISIILNGVQKGKDKKFNVKQRKER